MKLTLQNEKSKDILDEMPEIIITRQASYDNGLLPLMVDINPLNRENP